MAKRRKIGEPISNEHVQMAYFRNMSSKIDILLKQFNQNNARSNKGGQQIEQAENQNDLKSSHQEYTQLKEKYELVTKTNKQLATAVRLLKTKFGQTDEENRMLQSECLKLRERVKELETELDEKAVQITQLESSPCKRCQQSYEELQAMREIVNVGNRTLEELQTLDHKVLAQSFNQLQKSILHHPSFIMENQQSFDATREIDD